MRRCAAFVVVTAALCLPDIANGERFLSIDEALKLCFPKQTLREERIHLTREQVAAIQKRCEVKVRKPVARLWTAADGTNVTGVLFFDQVIGKHELIDYVVALSLDGKVRQIEILEYREHYGGKVRDSEWRAQFQGKGGTDPLKLNGDIYNITGATLSCRHVTEGVRRILATFDVVVRPRLSAGMPDQPGAAR